MEFLPELERNGTFVGNWLSHERYLGHSVSFLNIHWLSEQLDEIED
jgi:hypothetical protein